MCSPLTSSIWSFLPVLGGEILREKVFFPSSFQRCSLKSLRGLTFKTPGVPLMYRES